MPRTRSNWAAACDISTSVGDGRESAGSATLPGSDAWPSTQLSVRSAGHSGHQPAIAEQTQFMSTRLVSLRTRTCCILDRCAKRLKPGCAHPKVLRW